MKTLETKTEKKTFTIWGFDWKQWTPFFGIYKSAIDGFLDGKVSLATTDSDLFYWRNKVYQSVCILGAGYGLFKLAEKII